MAFNHECLLDWTIFGWVVVVSLHMKLTSVSFSVSFFLETVWSWQDGFKASPTYMQETQMLFYLTVVILWEEYDTKWKFSFTYDYGIIFWGNSGYNHEVFKLQRVVRIITGSRSRDSCCGLFKNINILTLPSEYFFSLLCLVTANRDQFMINSEILYSSTNIEFII